MKFFRIAFLWTALTAQIALAQGVVRVPPPPPRAGLLGRPPHPVTCGLRDTNAGTVGDTNGFRDIGSIHHGAVRFGCRRVGYGEEMAGSFAQGAGGNRRF